MRRQMLITTSIIAIIVIILGISVFGMFKNKPPKSDHQSEPEAQKLEHAAMLLQKSKPDEALEIIHKHKGEMETQSENGTKWLALFIDATEQTKNRSQMTALFEFSPDIFKDHETAALLVADTYISSKNLQDYEKVRALWSDRETMTPSWVVLDVDKLLLEDRRAEAIELLKSQTFEGKKDVGRLVRLALLYNVEDPKAAWQYLLEAYAIDPNNPDIRYYRAKLLESAGKHSLAHKEYQAAASLHPDNAYLQDELAEFYLRQRQYQKALEIWEKRLSPSTLDQLWVKTLFWRLVAMPLDRSKTLPPEAEGKLQPLVQYLANLGEGTFWNKEQFDKIENQKLFLQTQQATFWLRILQDLATGNEVHALKLLQYNPFVATSWNPELEVALKQVLTYRDSRSLKPLDTLSPNDSRRILPPLLFQQLNELATNKEGDEVPEELKALLLSEEAFSALFIAAEWYEAGLQLHRLSIFPETFPNWATYNLTQALRQNRTEEQALDFAVQQSPSPELNLLIAELMIATGNPNEALKKLTPLSRENNDLGFRSAWLASLLYMEKEDYSRARDVIQAQPQLVENTLGQEVLARLAHLEGDKELASQLYRDIETQSVEAQSYLAKEAFEKKDWARARELTEQLVQKYPNNAMLKQNLEKIMEEQSQEQDDTP